MIYGSWYKNMENLANIIIQVGISRQIHQFNFTCRVKLNIHYFSRLSLALMFLLVCVVCWHWGLVARKSRFCLAAWSWENDKSSRGGGGGRNVIRECPDVRSSAKAWFISSDSLWAGAGWWWMISTATLRGARHHVIFTPCVHRKLASLLSSSFTQTHNFLGLPVMVT